MKLHNEQMNAQRSRQIEEITTKLDIIRSSTVSQEDFAQLHDDLVHILTTGRSVAIEQKVLQSLLFPQMKVRHERIKESHRNTFDWIFESESATENQTHQRPKVHFMEWLRSSAPTQSIYWLGGKAGSGKSTLMKYLCTHDRVQTELQAWSGADPPVAASFFFWRYGTELQKSQEGLLRSLLFEVLRKCPSIISKVTEMRWTYAVRDPWSRPKEQEPWTQSEMMQVFNLFEDEHINAKFCFFIDGLDEYNGDPSDLIELIHKLARSPNVKFCVSSRPLTEFRKVFDVKDRALYLHELTSNDIRTYVRDKLEQNDRFIQEGRRDGSYRELVMDIVERAQGVFLWVYLVVKSLLQGLTHADSIQILQQRLWLIPTDLEELFSHMIGSVDPIYERQMGRTFQVALAASEPLPLILFYSLDELETRQDVALRAKVHTRQEWDMNGNKLLADAMSQISGRESDMRIRLDARSRGLLEVSTNSSHSNNAASLRVEFLHRTVRDYLENQEISDKLTLLANKAEKTGRVFVPEVALCHFLLAGIKLLPPGYPGDKSTDEMLEFVDDLLWYAHRAERLTQAAQKDVLDELDKTLGMMFPPENSLSRSKGPGHSFQPLHPKILEKFGSVSLAELCVQRGLSKYFSLKVSPELVAGRFKQPLLFHALLPLKSPKHGLVNTYESVPLLLENGADPKAVLENGHSIWGSFLESRFKNSFDISVLQYSQLPDVEVVDQMLRAGANANIKLAGRTVFGWIIDDDSTDTPWDQRIHMFQSFVRHGASPNAQWDESTIWQQRLESLYRTRNETNSSRYFEEVKLLLQAKADVNVRVWKEGTTCTKSKGRKAHRANYQTVEEAIKAIFDPHQAAELLQIADEMRDRRMISRLKRSFHGIVQRTA